MSNTKSLFPELQQSGPLSSLVVGGGAETASNLLPSFCKHAPGLPPSHTCRLALNGGTVDGRRRGRRLTPEQIWKGSVRLRKYLIV